LGKLTRNIQCNSSHAGNELTRQLELSERLLKQQRKDKGKLYSIHAQKVECITKGKANKPYEFGCNVAMVSSSKGNWVVGINAIYVIIHMTVIP